jgi:hypothetical protein
VRIISSGGKPTFPTCYCAGFGNARFALTFHTVSRWWDSVENISKLRRRACAPSKTLAVGQSNLTDSTVTTPLTDLGKLHSLQQNAQAAFNQV